MKRLKDKIKKDYAFLLPVVGRIYQMFRDWRFHFITWQIQYKQFGLITEAGAEFMQDPRYVTARNTAIRECKCQPPTGGDWRLYTFAWASDYAKNIEGDYVELGVNRGLTSRIIVDYINFKDLNKTFYLVDMFGEGDGYGNVYEETKEVFAPYPNVLVIKGRVPEILPEIPVEKIAYLHIDMNSVEPEMQAIDYLWDKVSKGGILMLCDYNVFARKPQRDAWNAWAKTKGFSILQLPTTQGMLIKP